MRKEEKNFRHYIRSMYRFYNYGIWTVLERKSGAIIGRVGIETENIRDKSVLEPGYLIGKDWRRQGFAKKPFRRNGLRRKFWEGRIHSMLYSPAK